MNIINSIINFFKKIFVTPETTKQLNSVNIEKNTKGTFLNNIKHETESFDATLLKIQSDLERGIISEKELDQDTINKLDKLYDAQIEELDCEISVKKERLKQLNLKLNSYYKLGIDFKTMSESNA